MNNRMVYTYAVLRYVHDVVSGECLNLGVVILSPTSRRIVCRFAPSVSRIVRAFPTTSTTGIKAGLAAIQASIEKLDVMDGDLTLRDLLARALPHDSSSFQWSEVGSGVTSNMDATLDTLHERFVAKYIDAFGAPEDAVERSTATAQFVRQRKIACNDTEADSWSERYAAGGV